MHVFTVMGAVLITHQSLLQRSPSDTEPHKTHANSKRVEFHYITWWPREIVFWVLCNYSLY